MYLAYDIDPFLIGIEQLGRKDPSMHMHGSLIIYESLKVKRAPHTLFGSLVSPSGILFANALHMAATLLGRFLIRQTR